MTWSTRQLAKLAGKTVKTVRQHHEIFLFDEPERSSNGYKHYEVTHLVRLLRIKRLVDLSVPRLRLLSSERASTKLAKRYGQSMPSSLTRLVGFYEPGPSSSRHSTTRCRQIFLRDLARSERTFPMPLEHSY